MHLLIVLLLGLATVHGQQSPCSCTCCNTQSCTPAPLPTVYVSGLTCTNEVCLAQCRAIYPQCQASPPYGQAIGQCGTTSVQLYSCRCDCCNSGSALCTPSYVGTSVAYTCQTSACSISCNQQYPSQCVSSWSGQTQGTCTGMITTTSTTTTIGPWLGNTCSCMCCQTGSTCTPVYVGIASASQCSTASCTQACQNRYSSMCPGPALYYLGQTSGTCTSSTTNGNTRCACRCYAATGWVNYDVRTNEGCSACNTLCSVQSACGSSTQVTFTCYANGATRIDAQLISLCVLGLWSLVHRLACSA